MPSPNIENPNRAKTSESSFGKNLLEIKKTEIEHFDGRQYKQQPPNPSTSRIFLLFQEVIKIFILILSNILRSYFGMHHYSWRKNEETKIHFRSLQDSSLDRPMSSSNNAPLPPAPSENAKRSQLVSLDIKENITRSLTEGDLIDEISEKFDPQNSTVDQIIDEIQSKIKERLELDDHSIEEKYKINSRIDALPGDKGKIYREKLSDIINTAYLVRFLRNKRKILEPVLLEHRLLNSLGYENATYKTRETYKDDIYAEFNNIIQSQLEPEDYSKSPREFRALLKNHALRARLRVAGINENGQIEKFQNLLTRFQESAKRLKDSVKSISVELPANIPTDQRPLAVRIIEKKLNSIKSRESLKALSRILDDQDIQSAFRNNRSKGDRFQQLLDEKFSTKEELVVQELIEACENAKQSKSINSLINFYAKWGSNIKAELIQGLFDSNEVLGEGVCFATCFRLLTELQPKPEEDFTGKLTITEQDRYNQSLYRLSAHLRTKDTVKQEIPRAEKVMRIAKDVPSEWLQKTNFEKSRHLFNFAYDPDELNMEHLLMKSGKIQDYLKASNGWMKLGLTIIGGSHAILMRLDDERKKAWLFDPNVGFFCFEAPHKSVDEAKKKCLECFRNLCSLSYPLLFNVDAIQLISK